MFKQPYFAGAYRTKESPQVGATRLSELTFKPASIDEIKMLVGNVDDLPQGYVAGWASTPSMDKGGDVVALGAFSDSIREKGVNGPRGIKFLAQHRADKPAGVIVKLEERAEGLWIEAQMNLEISYVNDLYQAAKSNGGLSFSIGYRLVEDGFKFVDDGDDSYWLLSKVDLHEISVVTIPMNDDAVMTFIKSDGLEELPSFDTMAALEKALVAEGTAINRNDANRLTRAVKRLLKNNDHLFVAQEDPPSEPLLAAEEREALSSVSAAIAEMRKSFT